MISLTTEDTKMCPNRLSFGVLSRQEANNTKFNETSVRDFLMPS